MAYTADQKQHAKDRLGEMLARLRDPIAFAKRLWPDVTFYREQRAMIHSALDNDETYVTAGNMLGKDFTAGFIALYFFLTRHPCRIVTTSAKDDHLRVLWGEINRYIQTCKVPLDAKQGGPLLVNHQDIRKLINGQKCPISYMIGLVASADTIAAMQGHHVAKTGDGIPRTMFMCDESSSVMDAYYKMATTWANRLFIFGNPWPCENFFRRGVRGGDLKRSRGIGYIRKVIKIRAVDSPNIRLALGEIAKAQEPSRRMLIDGVKDYDEYEKNLATWDEIQQCVSLEGEFYEGLEVKLYPADWLNKSALIADELDRQYGLSGRRKAKGIGIDSGQGKANTCWTAVDEHGIIAQVSKKTKNTAVITGDTIAFAREHGILDIPEKWVFDAGGGGLEHADRLREQGYPVRTVAFGEAPSQPPRRGMTPTRVKIEIKEERYVYRNRRAEMYGILRTLLNPARRSRIFAIPARYTELRRQLGLLPLMYDGEGRMKLPPKNKREIDSTEVTLTEMLGCSPDESDSLVLAVFAMEREQALPTAGAI
jgi:hypothetical protein